MDTLYHRLVPASCPQCKKKDREFEDVCEELATLRKMMGEAAPSVRNMIGESEFSKANDKAAELLEKVRRLRALHQINSASMDEVDDIYGVGTVTAKKIIQMRPFNSLEDVDRIVPGASIHPIIRWSDRRWQKKRQPPI